LNHSIDNDPSISREKVVQLAEVTGDLNPITLREISDQPLKGGGQAEILEDMGAQVLGQAMDIFNDLIDV
jgi:hypothetical protein